MSVDTPEWVRHAVFYQVFPERLARSGRVEAPGELEPWGAPPTVHGFKGGDLHGVIGHLDRLRQLGITALYLNPVFASAANHRYHTDDYYHVDPLLGGDAALRELLDEAHAREMRVVLDGVFNHSGRGFWPFRHVLENGGQSPYRDWFHLADDVYAGHRSISAFPSDAQLEHISAMRMDGAPSGTSSRSVLGYEAWWDLPALPKLNLDEPHLRATMLDVTEHWIRFGADGWRLDVAEEVGIDFWREFRQRVRAVNPEAYIVAEIWSPKPDWLRGDTFDAFMNYSLLEAVVGFVAGDRIDRSLQIPDEWQGRLPVLDAAAFWSRWQELESLVDPDVTAVQLNLLGSHDTPRLRTLCGGDLAAVRLAMLLQLTLPGAPCIYYGDEIGLAGTMDPGCRQGFPVDTAEWDHGLLAWVSDLIALRHSSRALRDGATSVLLAEGQAFAMLRRFGPDAFVVAVNAADTPLSMPISLPMHVDSAGWVPVGPDGAGTVELDHGHAEPRWRVHLAPRSGGVVRLRLHDQGRGRL